MSVSTGIHLRGGEQINAGFVIRDGIESDPRPYTTVVIDGVHVYTRDPADLRRIAEAALESAVKLEAAIAEKQAAKPAPGVEL